MSILSWWNSESFRSHSAEMQWELSYINTKSMCIHDLKTNVENNKTQK